MHELEEKNARCLRDPLQNIGGTLLKVMDLLRQNSSCMRFLTVHWFHIQPEGTHSLPFKINDYGIEKNFPAGI